MTAHLCDSLDCLFSLSLIAQSVLKDSLPESASVLFIISSHHTIKQRDLTLDNIHTYILHSSHNCISAYDQITKENKELSI